MCFEGLISSRQKQSYVYLRGVFAFCRSLLPILRLIKLFNFKFFAISHFYQFFTTNVKIFPNHTNQLQQIWILSDSFFGQPTIPFDLEIEAYRVDIMMKFAAIFAVAFQGSIGVSYGLRVDKAKNDIGWPKPFSHHVLERQHRSITTSPSCQIDEWYWFLVFNFKWNNLIQ